MLSRSTAALAGLVALSSVLALPSLAGADAPHRTAIGLNEGQAPAGDTARLLTRSDLPCPGPDCAIDGMGPDDPTPQPHGQGLRRVYLNFDGVTLTSANNNENATQNISFLISNVVAPGNTLTIPPFNHFDLSSTQGASRQQIIDFTVAQLRETHAAYNIEFTTTRPTSGTYHMVVFGGTCPSVIGDNCAGIAHLDCGDLVNSNIVFAFPSGLRIQDLPATASQELAHAFGLSHTTDQTDIMFPFIQNSSPVAYGAGPIPQEDQGSACGGAVFQDSHERMLAIIGFPGQDTTPPTVLITSPSNGDIVTTGAPVIADITDDSEITKVELLLNNTVYDTRLTPPYDFTIPADSPLGQVAVAVQATDSAGHTNKHKVTAYIGNGNEEPCVNGQCEEGFDCVEGLCYSQDPGSFGNLGDFCGGSDDCQSSICAESDGEMRCSQSCDVNNPCPSGFTCLGETACWPEDQPEDEGGCSTAGGQRSALGALGLLLLALLPLRRRRQH